MAHATTSKPLTFYVDTPSVRVFQEFAGDSLDKLDQYDVWDIITVLCQSVAMANMVEDDSIDIHESIKTLEIELRDRCQECLNALHGFPASQVNALMIGILAVAFEV